MNARDCGTIRGGDNHIGKEIREVMPSGAAKIDMRIMSKNG